MKCPACDKTLVIRNAVLINMDSYGKPVTAATDCCGKAVYLTPHTSFDAVIADGRTYDDWGVAVTR